MNHNADDKTHPGEAASDRACTTALMHAALAELDEGPEGDESDEQ